MPACSAGPVASSHSATTSARKPVAALAVFGQRLVAPVVAVETDRRRADQHLGPVADCAISSASRRVGPDPAVADRGAVLVGEAAGDRGARQVDHRVDAGQQIRVGIVGIPLPLIRFGGRMTHQPDHPVAAGGQEGGQLRRRPARRSR